MICALLSSMRVVQIEKGMGAELEMKKNFGGRRDLTKGRKKRGREQETN